MSATSYGLALSLALLVPSLAGADEPPKPWYALISVDAFVSASYEWNFNKPNSNTNQLRAFDYDHNSFRIDAAELVLQKPVVNPGDYGFRVDVAYGAVAKIAAARGLFRDPTTGVALDIDLQQAYASYILPIGKGLRCDFGKFVTPVGAEFIDGFDGYNDNFSRSLLFTFAIPFTHTGLRLTYAFNDKLTVLAMLENGWDNVVDNNAAKSFGVQAAITPSPKLALYVSYLGGPERDGDDKDFRHLVDVGAVYKPHWRFTLTFNGDWGMDQDGITETMLPLGATEPASVKRSSAMWLGGALYLRVQATHRLAFVGRGELFWDRDGFRTGVKQLVGEVTLTPEFRISDQMLVRVEGRLDQSDALVFERSDGGHRKYQWTAAANVLYAF